jgi:hypothetical protein
MGEGVPTPRPGPARAGARSPRSTAPTPHHGGQRPHWSGALHSPEVHRQLGEPGCRVEHGATPCMAAHARPVRGLAPRLHRGAARLEGEVACHTGGSTRVIPRGQAGPSEGLTVSKRTRVPIDTPGPELGAVAPRWSRARPMTWARLEASSSPSASLSPLHPTFAHSSSPPSSSPLPSSHLPPPLLAIQGGLQCMLTPLPSLRPPSPPPIGAVQAPRSRPPRLVHARW